MSLQRHSLFLGRTLSDSTKTDVHASFCRSTSCCESGRLTIASPSTEQLATHVDTQDLHRHLITPPAAPRRKLAQHTFQFCVPTAYASTAAAPMPGGMSDPSTTLYQHVHNYYLQPEAVEAKLITNLPQPGTCAASMSTLLAVAKPISSAEHLLQRLQTTRGSAAAVDSDGQSSGNHVASALTSCTLLDTGATNLMGTGCTPSSPVHSDSGSFQGEKVARPQPNSRAHVTKLVDNWLAQSQEQSTQTGEIADHGAERPAKALRSCSGFIAC